MTESKAVPMMEQLLVPKVMRKKVGGIWKKCMERIERGGGGGEKGRKSHLVQLLT